MVNQKKSLNFISDEEQVARILFSPSHIAEGRVSPKAFRLEILRGGAEDYVSVLRDEENKLKDVSAKFIPRTKGDEIYGYTLLKAKAIRDLDAELESRDVELVPKPSKRLPLHAGISLFIDGKQVTAKDISSDIDYFQKELALICENIHEF